ncbi:MAG: HAMP domain-containing sensor histidine kinase [Bacteroidota bacterium]
MPRFPKAALPWLDRFLPAWIVHGPSVNRFQARLVTAILLIAIPLNLILLALDFLRGAYEYAAITFTFSCFCILCLWLIKRTGHHQRVAIAFTLIPVFTLTRAALQGYGLNSLYIPILLAIPSIGFIMARRRGGLILTGATLCALTVLFYQTPPTPLSGTRYGILVGALLFLTSCVMAFYNLNQTTLKKVKKAYQQLEALNNKLENRSDRLRKALEANTEILGITAHDLKNPLGGIIGLAEMVLYDSKAGAQAAHASVTENLPLLRDEAERMLHIVKELLDKHRQGEEIELTKESASLNDLITTVLRWNDVQANEKQITLHFDTSEAAYGDVDVVSIQRVIDNYLSNAIKYSPEGTNIWVEKTTVIPPYDIASRMIKISVRDEGPGLTATDREKVFGKMQRLSAKPTAGEHSTGLGLFIVKSLVELHGGEVGVDSVPGQGASFWFTLPINSTIQQATTPLNMVS